MGIPSLAGRRCLYHSIGQHIDVGLLMIWDVNPACAEPMNYSNSSSPVGETLTEFGTL